MFVSLTLTLLCMTFFMNNCTWDDSLYKTYTVDGKIISCPDLEAIYLENGTKITESHPFDANNKSYEIAFTSDICPAVSPTCVTTPEGKSVCTTCNDNQQLCYGVCLDYAANKVFSCETDNIQCAEHFADCDDDVSNGCEYALNAHHATDCQNKTVNIYCEDGYGDCNDNYLDGCETNILSSHQHCGGCSTDKEDYACPPGKVCNGQALCADSCLAGSISCGGSCINTTAHHIDVQAGGCEDILDADNHLASTIIYCVDNYANCDDDPLNGCEFQLSTGNALSCKSQSLVCRDVFADCDGDYLTGCEYNLIPNHALACMRTEDEDGTVHVELECAPDYADCDGDYQNGCEYQLSTHNAIYCERKTDETTNEIYVELTCANNMADCDGNYLNGCEYDMRLNHVTACVYNIEYCSGEDVDCDDETSDAIQKRGLITCDASFADIDKDYQNGCEIDGNTDREHCGARGDASSDDNESPDYKGEACSPGYLCNGGTCGVTCTTPLQNCGGVCIDFAANHIQTCYTYTMTLSSWNCEAGWADCDGQLNNGCEYNLSAHNASACTNETVTCTGGYENCDGKYLNGCETDILGSDVANCGACGLNCTDNDNVLYAQCNAGKCVATQCQSGYRLSATGANNTCVSNSDTACAAPNAVTTVNCNTANNATAGTCNTNGTCKATACKAGYYLASGACVACPPGTYKTAADASACLPCAAGTYNGSAGRTSTCTNCSADYYSTAGASSCTACPSGSHSTAGSAACKVCTAASHCAKTTGANSMACSSNQCVASTCNKGYYLANGTCVACPVGTYKNQANAATSCTPCAAGTYSNQTARTSACTNCSAGYYSTAGARSCTKCPSGYSSSAGASYCKKS